ncbi:DNRLRE domain-containing protein [Peribacillus acanthi]|uniref:DNRLRE domain-containing protein n=1 Tax=Peribacillus acanthi TaxID=2171554 RepID=UPI000D3E2D6D|nr:DNRLRE domain-containing protein [Peribacillus acanthi]
MSKKFKKQAIRWLSVMLATTIIFSFLPKDGVFTVFAEIDEKPIVQQVESSAPKTNLFKEEVKELRTAYSKTFLKSNGTFVAEISQTPIHFKNDNDQWESINNELVSDSKENVYENKANDFTVKFSEKHEVETPVFKIEDEQYSTELQLEPLEHTGEQAANVEGVVEGESITYPDVYSNIDIKYTVGSDRIKEDIIYTEKPEKGFPTVFTYKMDLEGMNIKQEGETLYLYDLKTNKPVYYFETPYMYDSFVPKGYKATEGIFSIPEEAISYDVKLTYEVINNQLYLYLSPNKQWLEDSKRVYPITIDPTMVKIQSSTYVEDTNLRSGFPTQTGGNDLELGGGSSGGNIIRTLLRFDLTTIPSATTILSSNLKLWFSSTNNNTPVDISLFKVSSDWNENEASWTYSKKLPTYTAWNYKGGDYVTSNKLSTVSGLTSPTTLDADMKQWDIPVHIIQNWRNNLSTNYGFMLKSDTEATNIYKKFVASENAIATEYKPLLEVTYKTPDQIAEEYGFTPVDPTTITPDQTMVFDSVEAFEQYLQEEDLKSQLAMENEEIITENEVTIAGGSTSKLYKYTEIQGVSKITALARVTRDSSKKVTNVDIWSEQTGIILGINWDEKTTWHELNSLRTGGKAYVRGIKTYGISVVGQSLGYNKSVTYKVPF